MSFHGFNWRKTCGSSSWMWRYSSCKRNTHLPPFIAISLSLLAQYASDMCHGGPVVWKVERVGVSLGHSISPWNWFGYEVSNPNGNEERSYMVCSRVYKVTYPYTAYRYRIPYTLYRILIILSIVVKWFSTIVNPLVMSVQTRINYTLPITYPL